MNIFKLVPVFFLEKLRVIFKSLGKKEDKIKKLLILNKFNKKFNKLKNLQEDFNPKKKINKKIKIFAVVCFYFNKDKINNLITVCKSLIEIDRNNEINIITNKSKKYLLKMLKKEIKFNIKIVEIKNLANDRMLPWHHINIMKKNFSRKNITHFTYLEDDILLTKTNFAYWQNSKKILKQFNLIPGFVRTEANQKNKQTYAIDFEKKIKIKNLPKFVINKIYQFVNSQFPYQGMYLYDRELMREYLFGPISNPDFGHGAYKVEFHNKEMINLDLMAKANIGLTFYKVPNYFNNRIVILYNKINDNIDESCCIKHLTNRYANEKSSFGNIKLKEALN